MDWQWDVAVLRISNYNPSCEIWCVTDIEMISEVKILSPSELLMDDEENETEINSQKKSKNDNKHKENNLRYEIFSKFGTNS